MSNYLNYNLGFNIFADADYLPASFADLTGLNSPSIKPDINKIQNISTANFEKDLDLSMNNKNLNNVQDWMDTSSVYVENSVEPFRGASSSYGGMSRSSYGGMNRYGSSLGTSPSRTKSQFRDRINNIYSSQDIKKNIPDKIVKNNYGGNNYYNSVNSSNMRPNINPLIFPAVIGGAAYSDYYNQNQPPININNLAPDITKNEVQMESEIKTRNEVQMESEIKTRNEVEMEIEQQIILEKLKNAKLKDELQNNNKISNDSSNNFWIMAVIVVLILVYIFMSNNKKLKNDTSLLTISNSSSNKLETTSFGF